MDLTPDEKAIGQDNFRRVSGSLLERDANRRDFLKEVSLAGAVAAGGFGAAYWGYGKKLDDRLRVGVIGTGDEGNVLIGALNPDFVQVKAIADIRPYSIHRAFYGDWYSDSARQARPGLCSVYGYKDRDEAEREIAVYEDYNDLLADDDVEAVIVALPLWLHHQASVLAMQAGKHVLTEKLMAWDVAQCKEMARVAEATGLLLATGHQRHYSVLYDNAVHTIQRGLIGDIHHIRAQWHRANLPGRDSWSPSLPSNKSAAEVKDLIREARKSSAALGSRTKQNYRLVLELDSWLNVLSGKHPKYGTLSPADAETWASKVEQKRAQLLDAQVDAEKWGYRGGELSSGYKYSALEELIRWRIWDRTGGGLMAELGSHQLDASGIFISSQFESPASGERAKVNPLSVLGVGGRHVFPHDRDCDDHVYASYEYPAKGYFENNDPSSGRVADGDKKCVVTYSSINGNGYGGYGEVVMGTDGTLILEREQDVMLYSGSKTGTKVAVDDKDSLVDSYETGGGYTPAAQAVTQAVSRGYREEIEHWAWCIRNDAPAETLHCHPKVALADAVIALTTNVAIARNERIEFDPEWFDPKSDAVPAGRTPAKADAVKASPPAASAGPVV